MKTCGKLACRFFLFSFGHRGLNARVRVPEDKALSLDWFHTGNALVFRNLQSAVETTYI